MAVPGEPSTLWVERVYGALKEAILRGDHLPGTHLVEADLTRRHQASRATIREALRRLQSDDLVEVIAHRGVRVRRLSLVDVTEIYALREPIEGLAARLAASVPETALTALSSIHKEAAAAAAVGDRIGFARLNVRFHLAVAEATGNRSLVALLLRLNTPLIGFQFLPGTTLDHQRAHVEHEAVLGAILARDPEQAERAMRRHLEATRVSILRASGDGKRDG